MGKEAPEMSVKNLPVNKRIYAELLALIQA
jgi:hypothetical protein